MVQVGACNDDGCDEDEGEDKNTETASEPGMREHCHDLEQMAEAKVDDVKMTDTSFRLLKGSS